RSVPPAAPAPRVEAPAPAAVATAPAAAPAPVAAPAPIAPPAPAYVPPASTTAYPPPTSNTKTGLVIGLAVAGAALLRLGVLAMSPPKDGKIAVFVAGAGGRTVENVKVFVNGEKKCETVPCRVELPKGVHEVKAMAP